LFTRDREPLVKAAAAQAIGKIGVDPEGIALRAFENAITPPSSINDEYALAGIAGAAGALGRFSGPPLSFGGIRILMILAVEDRFSIVRNRAQAELRTLW
ncbi:MAG: hypothetical protein LBH43_17875, partial [Treponema sp.]|nr:hypothetical protein [Treponema sp.]